MTDLFTNTFGTALGTLFYGWSRKHYSSMKWTSSQFFQGSAAGETRAPDSALTRRK
jgi:glycopeptide antibiotics resistance protein